MKRTRMAEVLVLACCPTLSPRAVGQAEDLYKAHCSSCHGGDGSGAPTAGNKMGVNDLRSPQVQSLSDDELFKTIAYGVNHKQYPHAFVKRGLTEAQITQIVSYLRKLAKSK